MKYLSMDELKTLLRSTPAKKPWQRLMLLVAFWHGLRVNEVVNITGKDIQHGYVDVKRLKGSMHTVQPYVSHHDPELDEAVALTDMAAKFKGTERIFPISDRGVRKMMERISKETGLNRKKMHPHALKHTIAMQSIKVAGIENVRATLGHKSLSSTGFYLTVNQDDAMKAIGSAIA